MVDPATAVASNFAENFSIASTPQAFASVVDQWPRAWRPTAPRTIRGMSSRHCGSFASASTPRTAFWSVAIISHQSASVRSVEKPIVVPWKLSRERRICFASAKRSARRGTFCSRSRTPSQSITAEVGQRFGSSAIESSIFGSAPL